MVVVERERGRTCHSISLVGLPLLAISNQLVVTAFTVTLQLLSIPFHSKGITVLFSFHKLSIHFPDAYGVLLFI